jgi:hypothetical protein
MTTENNYSIFQGIADENGVTSSFKSGISNGSILIADSNLVFGVYKPSALFKDSGVAINPSYMRLLPAKNDDIIYEFYFPFAPMNISYENLSDEIAEIPRPGTTPILAFKSHRLLKVSFEFIIAKPSDGLVFNVQQSLDILRSISTNSHRSIQFINMDALLTTVKKYRNSPSNIATNASLYFKVSELSITSVRRNSNGEITHANGNISLIEDQNPTIAKVKIPKIGKPVPKKKIGGDGGKKTTKRFRLRSGEVDTTTAEDAWMYS